MRTDLTRRRFLQGAAATAGATALVPSWLSALAGASPLGATEGVVVVVMLGGGNDGLNTLVPYGDGTYQDLRGPLAIPAGSVLDINGQVGLHPSLANLKARYDAGRVAIVRGVGQPDDDLSHFTSMATWMAGTATSSRSTGWLGRYLDGVSEAADGLRGITVTSSVPLHLLGNVATITALSPSGDMFGADQSEAFELALQNTVTSFASSTTGRGTWGDALAAAGSRGVGTARQVAPLYTPEPPEEHLSRQLVLCARLINLDLGARVLNTTLDSFDTHSGQLSAHADLLSHLDAGIEAFFDALAPAFAKRVTLMVFSEFGRRPERNDSDGTDHGTAGLMIVAGENVKGGLHGAQPSLTDLDDRGNLRRHVDFRSVYATVLDRWLNADESAVLGGSYEVLDLFAATPGGDRTTTPPPPPPNPAAPFASWGAFVNQQVLDTLFHPASTATRDSWVSKINGGMTPGEAIAGLIGSSEHLAKVSPVARLYRAFFRRHPDWPTLERWVSAHRSGTSLPSIASSFAKTSEFRAKHAGMGNAAYVDWAYSWVLRRSPTATERSSWKSKLDHGAARSLLIHDLSTTSTYKTLVAKPMKVDLVHGDMLRRAPSSSTRAAWVAKLGAGTPLAALAQALLQTAEYRARFG